MPRALLAIFLSLLATSAFASRTLCTEDPTLPVVKADKPAVVAAPAVATAPVNRAPVATTVATVPAAAPATGTANANTNGGATHPSRPRVSSPRWQSLLPGMIR